MHFKYTVHTHTLQWHSPTHTHTCTPHTPILTSPTHIHKLSHTHHPIHPSIHPCCSALHSVWGTREWYRPDRSRLLCGGQLLGLSGQKHWQLRSPGNEMSRCNVNNWGCWWFCLMWFAKPALLRARNSHSGWSHLRAASEVIYCSSQLCFLSSFCFFFHVSSLLLTDYICFNSFLSMALLQSPRTIFLKSLNSRTHTHTLVLILPKLVTWPSI